VSFRSWIPPGSCSIVVIAAVEPGTNTEATPRSTPACCTTAATRWVMSTASPWPCVESRSCSLEAGKELFEAGRLVRRHLVAVLRLRISPVAHVGGERGHSFDHRLAHVAVALHEARGVAVVDPEQVVEHEHLPVGCRPGADSDHRNLDLRHDRLGQVA